MEKVLGNWLFTSVCDDAWTKQENAKKTRRRMSLILPLVCVLFLGRATASLATTTCGAPDTCVVVFDNYLPKPGLWRVQISSITNVDHSCSILSIGSTNTIIEYVPWYDHTIIKWYWDGRYWQQLGGGHAYTADVATGADYANDLMWIGSNNYVYPQTIYPNGCSDLPSQQPNQTPNPDPGKPDCPQVPLN